MTDAPVAGVDLPSSIGDQLCVQLPAKPTESNRNADMVDRCSESELPAFPVATSGAQNRSVDQVHDSSSKFCDRRKLRVYTFSTIAGGALRGSPGWSWPTQNYGQVSHNAIGPPDNWSVYSSVVGL